MTTLERTVPVLAAVFFAAASLAAPAHAEDRASCTAIELGASKAASPSIPAELKPIAKNLKKPPLSAWNSFKVMSSSDFQIDGMKAASPKLVAGSVSVILRDVDARSGKRPRLSLGISMDGQNGKRVVDTKVSVDAGDYLVFGETLSNDDGHFVALSCKL
jgi:hypothetical protein